MTIPSALTVHPPRLSRTILAAGVIQLGAMFTPAVRVRLAGTKAFMNLPTAGIVLLALGVITLIVAFRPGGWWRWLPGTLTAVVIAVAYQRIVTAPSGTFADPLLRHAVHPAWGFGVMCAAIVVSLVGAALVRGSRPIRETDRFVELRPPSLEPEA